ncbi:hypothetical protein CSUI_008084 [Cystoisospora suis]|uniref:Uncharacterized protein n=1 Tax=Cystoisospora suis TaxID=483139 RepID=A0A2C6KB79_9APIC|nr:hypothetical protein CSUI_008084 [Cystoisospora suis]
MVTECSPSCRSARLSKSWICRIYQPLKNFRLSHVYAKQCSLVFSRVSCFGRLALLVCQTHSHSRYC